MPFTYGHVYGFYTGYISSLTGYSSKVGGFLNIQPTNLHTCY